VDADLRERDRADRPVELAIARAVEPGALLAARDASSGATPASLASVASVAKRSTSPTSARIRAAVITPQPGISTSPRLLLANQSGERAIKL
jgi:hypothetical protein